MRYVQFWLTGRWETEDLTGLRGQAVDSGDDPDLYEIFKDGEFWVSCRWVFFETDPDGHAYQEIKRHVVLYEVLAATENDARKRAETLAELHEPDDSH